MSRVLPSFGALDLKDLLVLAEMNVAWPEFIYELHLELSKHDFENKQTVLFQLQGKFQAISLRVQSAHEYEMHMCRIPDDCIDLKRYPLFMAREVMRQLIDKLCVTTADQPGALS